MLSDVFLASVEAQTDLDKLKQVLWFYFCICYRTRFLIMNVKVVDEKFLKLYYTTIWKNTRQQWFLNDFI